MTMIKEIGTKEDFLVQVNGDYNTIFDQVSVATAGKSGEVITVSAGVFGILAADKETGAKVVRVMVRGNPTTVNAKALDFKALAVPATTLALEKQGIILVNKAK